MIDAIDIIRMAVTENCPGWTIQTSQYFDVVSGEFIRGEFTIPFRIQGAQDDVMVLEWVDTLHRNGLRIKGVETTDERRVCYRLQGFDRDVRRMIFTLDELQSDVENGYYDEPGS